MQQDKGVWGIICGVGGKGERGGWGIGIRGNARLASCASYHTSIDIDIRHDTYLQIGGSEQSSCMTYLSVWSCRGFEFEFFIFYFEWVGGWVGADLIIYKSWPRHDEKLL